MLAWIASHAVAVALYVLYAAESAFAAVNLPHAASVLCHWALSLGGYGPCLP